MSRGAFPTRIAYAEACRLVDGIARQRRDPEERRALARTLGQVLSHDVFAVIAQPPFDNAAMDGFALRGTDLGSATGQSLRLVGDRFAGDANVLAVGPGECARITTGAALPPGADTVLVKEQAEIVDGRVRPMGPATLGQHVRRQGEDVQPGDLLLRAGCVLTPSRLALVAAQGVPELVVNRRPTVAVFTTGDELVEPGLPLPSGCIYNSNREQLMGLLRADGLDPVAWPTLPDDPAQLESALRHAGHAFDVVLTCGGVSAGEKDHLPELLQAHASPVFWRVRMKPGMPVLLAEGGTLGNAIFLCLPGNPVSVLANYLTLGRRLLDGLQGRGVPRTAWHARLGAGWRKTHERTEFLRGRLRSTPEGTLMVDANPADGSHRMQAAADSDVLIVLEEGARDYTAGTVVEVHPY